MTDFVIVAAAVASLASAASAVPGPSPGPSAVLPERAPTVGFHTYRTAEACMEAAAGLAAAPGTRLVCLPVETAEGDLASAY